jgi:alanine dehydrogenase
VLKVGVPKEIKDYENRVALTPRSVASLTSSGVTVTIEHNAGQKSGFSDSEYVSAGAQIASDADELYSKSDIIVKVKEAQIDKAENTRISKKHILFGYNHFESSKDLTNAAVKSGATFISYEKVVDQDNQTTPLLMPMSRIAGTLAGIWAGFYHNYAFKHDRTLRLKAGADEIKSRYIEAFEHIVDGKIDDDLVNKLTLQDKQVVIFGGGIAGEAAARVCNALKAKLIIVEKRDSRRKYLQELGLGRCSIMATAEYDILKSSSAMIGATYDKERADRVVDEKMLKDSSEVRKKIIIDISVDQGGNFPFVDQSGKYSPESMGTIMSPAQIDYFGNVFVRVPNMPSIVPRYASMALSNAITEYVRAIASGKQKQEVERATSISNGKILDEAITRAHGSSSASSSPS